MTTDPVPARLRSAVAAAHEKKAEGVQVLDLRGLTGITDFFLICHGTSKRQVQAIADEIELRLRQARARPDHVEGSQDTEWVLMDYLDFVVHVFTRDRRSFYALEKLWADAPRVDLAAPARAAGAAPRRRPRS